MARPVWPDENGLRPCSYCKSKFPATLDYFYLNSKSPTGLSSRCRACTKLLKKESNRRIRDQDLEGWRERCVTYRKRYRDKYPDKVRESDLRTDLKRKYGLTLPDYLFLLEKQNGVCAICKKPSDIKGRRLAIDHDHKCCPDQNTCGKCIRGLLCYTCNAGLGGLEDYLKEAEDYLNAYRING